MIEPLLAALRAVREEITKLHRAEAAILNLIGGEPMPCAVPHTLPEPSPDQPPLPPAPAKKKPKRREGWYPTRFELPLAKLIADEGPLTVDVAASRLKAPVAEIYILTKKSPWFTRVGRNPASIQLTVLGRSKAEEATHDPVA